MQQQQSPEISYCFVMQQIRRRIPQGMVRSLQSIFSRAFSFLLAPRFIFFPSFVRSTWYDGVGIEGTKADRSGDSASFGEARYGYRPFDGNHIYPGSYYSGDSASSGGARNHGYDGQYDGRDSFEDFDVSRSIAFSILDVIASLAVPLGLIMGVIHYFRFSPRKSCVKGSFLIIGYLTSLTLFGSLTLLLPAREAGEDGKAAIAIVYFVLALIFACYAKVIWRTFLLLL